jgi:hypothetical protein
LPRTTHAHLATLYTKKEKRSQWLKSGNQNVKFDVNAKINLA